MEWFKRDREEVEWNEIRSEIWAKWEGNEKEGEDGTERYRSTDRLERGREKPRASEGEVEEEQEAAESTITIWMIMEYERKGMNLTEDKKRRGRSSWNGEFEGRNVRDGADEIG